MGVLMAPLELSVPDLGALIAASRRLNRRGSAPNAFAGRRQAVRVRQTERARSAEEFFRRLFEHVDPREEPDMRSQATKTTLDPPQTGIGPVA
jgi:hypothetical protein